MSQHIILLFVIYFSYIIQRTNTLLCYNGTFNSKHYGNDPLQYRGLFSPSRRTMARIRCSLTVLCPENAMCFVRSWSARAQHAWMVQRGCYLPVKDDPLPRSLYTPTRAMSCKHERLPDAEYKVCLCQANWCNSASPTAPLTIQHFMKSFITVISFIFKLYVL